MIERRMIAVTGLPGGGKTTLIERLLEAKGADDIHCVRAEKRARRGKQDALAGDLERYRQAGARGISVYAYSAATHPEAFFESEPFHDVQDAIVVEGDLPPGVYSDLTVFVFRPRRLSALLKRVPRVSRSEFARAAKRYEAALARDAALERFVVSKMGELGRLLTATPGGRAAARQAMRNEGPPKFSPDEAKWALAPGFEGIVTAGLVVLNVSSAAERKGAEALRTEIERLRTDDAVFHDVMGIEGNRVPKTIVVADLRDPADPETKKAIRRLAKVWA